MTDKLTLKQWQRRALKAEAEIESVRKMRQQDTQFQMQMYRDFAACQVALKEAKEVIDWALGGQT